MGTPELTILVLGLLAFLVGRALLRRSREQSGASPRRACASRRTSGLPAGSRPFGWQAALIILPVAVLAVLGLLSIRQDRALAEQQARQQAAALVTQVAADLGRRLEAALSEYRSARFSLVADWRISLGYGEWAEGTDLARVRRQISEWQSRHPELPLALQPADDFSVTAEGRLAEAMAARADGRPPAWLVELESDHRRRWYSAQTALAAGQTEEARRNLEALLSGALPAPLRANAEFARLIAEGDGSDPAALRELARRHESVPTETGLSLGQLALWHALRRMPGGHGWDPADVESLVRFSAGGSSPLLRPLLQELRRLARPDSTEDAAALAKLDQFVASGERTAEVAADLAREHPSAIAQGGAVWVSSGNGRFFAMVDPLPPREHPQTAAPPAAAAVRLFPEAVVTEPLAAALAESSAMVPRYARLRVALGGREFEHGQSNPSMALITDLPLMAETGAALRVYLRPRGAPERRFHVRVFLADAPLLYAQQRQRAWLFGGLILVAAGTAGAGLVSAHRAFRRQLQLSELKSNFVSSVSHELRAPVASMRLLTESLERGTITDESKRQDYFRLIGQECRRLSALIENVLDFSRIDQGRKQYEFEPTDLVALVQQTVQLMEPYAAARQVRLGFTPPPPWELQLVLDGKAIQQALVNLIDNAVKHSPPGEVVTVALACPGDGVQPPARAFGSREPAHGLAHPASPAPVTRHSSVVILSVADHGPGIPPAEHARIFEPFYRRGSELRRETQGVGIGLTIVKHVVEAHGGRVWVESEPGNGSCFVIELPADASAAGKSEVQSPKSE